MSRIGREPIEIPSGVDVMVGDDALVTVKGPRGSLSQRMHTEMKVVQGDGSLHGLTRTLIANMVEGVTKGYEKRLAIVGVGYRATMKGSDLEILVGYSHPVSVPAPEGIEFETPTATSIVVRGNDKQLVGEVAANIRKIRKPEPYKGKGIRYENEFVRKKAGKAAKGSA